jgi:hypothetical protein
MCVKGSTVSGYQGKGGSSEIRWLGPYPVSLKPAEGFTGRHADSATIDHIIDLRKRLAVAEEKLMDANRQRDNALDMVMSLHKQLKLEKWLN